MKHITLPTLMSPPHRTNAINALSLLHLVSGQESHPAPDHAALYQRFFNPVIEKGREKGARYIALIQVLTIDGVDYMFVSGEGGGHNGGQTQWDELPVFKIF
jgi:hypothetical protein